MFVIFDMEPVYITIVKNFSIYSLFFFLFLFPNETSDRRGITSLTLPIYSLIDRVI